MKAAGIGLTSTSGRESWSKEKIVQKIRELYERGEDLSQKSVSRKHPALLAAAKSRRYFGSWGEAVKAAGVEYGMVKRRAKGKVAKGRMRSYTLVESLTII